jgi:hypothetical protein
MLTVLLIPLSVLLILVGGLWFFSPGRSSSIVDEGGRPVVGSLSEQIRVTINGVEQGMFIRGRDATKPVLLFVHGGAGMPEYFLFQKYSTAREVLEEHFTVCWWERRGAGLSYSAHLSPHGVLVEASSTFEGYTIPTQIRAGWFFGSDRFASEGEFFRCTIDKAIYR